MGVLDKVKHTVTGQWASRLIPDGATSAKAVGEGGSWKLVFEVPEGTIEVDDGGMERAVKLAMRAAREIARRAKEIS